MKRIASQFTHLNTPVVVVMLIALMFLASPAPSPAASSKQAKPTAGKVSKADRVEAHIKDLHAKLKITPAQDELWNNVAEAMRENAKTMDELIKARSEKANTMNAVDDLKSYSEIVEARAAGIKKLIPPFELLYTSMSDAQKKDADKLFRFHRHHRHKKTKSKTKSN